MKVSEIRPIRVSFAETEQLIRIPKNYRATNERDHIGRNSGGKSKREDYYLLSLSDRRVS